MKTIRHTGIYVDKLEDMKTFYTSMFGMKIAVHAIEESKYIDTILGLTNVKIELYKLKCEDGSLLEILKASVREKRVESRVYQLGCYHVAFTVTDIDKLAAKLKKERCELLSEPCIAPDGKAKVCFCRDPEGNYLELVEELF